MTRRCKDQSSAGLFLLLSILAGCAGMPENMAPPALPTAVTVPRDQRHVMTLKAQGTLNYECRARAGMSGAYAWTLDAPDAALLHWSGFRVGRYYAGPTLEYRDGSRVIAKLVASSPDDPGKLPIQLLQAVSPRGSGEFTDVTYIQRLNATGGEPSTRCTAGDVGKASRVDFTADFLFYKKR